MAMSKAEKAEFNRLENEKSELQLERDLYASFYISKEVLPDVPKPVNIGFNDVVRGYSYNSSTITAYETWSNTCSNGVSHDDFSRGYQDSIAQYSTKLLALKALRHQVAIKHAADLVKIDKMILKIEENEKC